MPITFYPGSMKKRNANGSYSDLVPAIATDPEVLDDFAEEYSTSKIYNIGDYCIHNSDLYKCNTNNTTGTWNINAWDRVTVGDELADHKNTLAQLETETETVENGLAIIVEGNTCVTGASQGQYVYLKDSTIAGYADGLYTAAQAIPENTAIDGTYLTAVSGGGFNSINDKIALKIDAASVTGLSKKGNGDLSNVEAIYIADSFRTGQDTIQFIFYHGSSLHNLYFGRSGIAYDINGSLIWQK